MRITSHNIKITSIILLVSLGSFSCFASPDWAGTYNYEFAQGNTVGGSPISMKYVLTVSGKDCSLSIDGFQTIERIRCRADTAKSTLHVRFKSYANGAVTNEFDVQIYEADQILFDLERSDTNITTIWKSEIPDENLPRTGTYFLKADNLMQ